MKRLILCCDGTWNRVDQSHNGVLCPTNVVRIAFRIAKHKDNMRQIVYYEQGVGTGNSLDRLTGGAFGKGVEDNIHQAYQFLIANYEPGDELYLFGFSRGAFTARSIAGMIRKCGILNREHVDQYLKAVDLYRSDEKPDEERPSEFRSTFSVNNDDPTLIRFIGVWDTVGALGIPLGALRGLTRKKHQFHDTELSGSVKYACHALAIDERRSPFKPTLWQYKPKEGQTVEQVWFPGVHSNIGGGYPDRALADLTLRWMIEKAGAAGLAFDDKVETKLPLSSNSNGVMYRSKKGWYRFTRGYDRDIGLSEKRVRDGDTEIQGEDPTQSVHPSALDRWDADPAYRPPGLKKYLKRIKDTRVS